MKSETADETQPPQTRVTGSRLCRDLRTSESTETLGGAQTSPRSTPTEDRTTVALSEGSSGTHSPQLKEGQRFSMKSPDKQQPIRVPIPREFYGEPTENPETFIENCEATFPRSFDDRMKTRLASRRLRGEAATWWSRNRTCTTTWDSFKNLLRGEFNSEELIASLRFQLYGEKQQQHEDARNFIQYRRQIALRLNPAATEESIIQAVLQTVHPSIKGFLIMGTFQTVQEMAVCAGRLQDNYNALQQEKIANADRRQRNISRQTDREAPRPPPAPLPRTIHRTQPPKHSDNYEQDTRPTRPPASLPQCRFCPGRHWHRHCPKAILQPGNGYAGKGAGTFPANQHTRRN
jgi:hypothetical protein